MMQAQRRKHSKRATVLVLIVGLLAMLFVAVSAFITLARSDRQTMVQLSKGAQVDRIVANVNEVIWQRIAAGGGTDLVTGRNYTPIPGYGPSRWLAALEPVRDPEGAAVQPNPVDYKYAAVSALGNEDAANVRLDDLMFKPTGMTNIEPRVQGNEGRSRNARRPFMDADGDGISDSSFPGSALATELANSLAGRSVNANILFDPNSVFEGTRALYRQFDQNARYEAAVRIISHGGMVTIGSPLNLDDFILLSRPTAWNAAFLARLFNYFRHPFDTANAPLDPNEATQLFYFLHGDRAAIEPALRMRGGCLVGRFGSDAESQPPTLQYLQQRFPSTLLPQYQGRSPWQRFNLADDNADGAYDWDVWRQAISLDPVAYNLAYQGGGSDPRQGLVQRRLLTTVNYSDELARIQSNNDPNVGIRIRPGALKFYLGDIGTRGAFSGAAFAGAYNYTSGAPIVRDLARYFTDMLASYGDVAGQWNDQAAKRSEQAYMLAVNTIAFAAPRDPATGKIASVWYEIQSGDSSGLEAGRRFFGYAPQPFITQVIAYNRPFSTDPSNLDPNNFDPNDVDPNSIVARVALAIELFNPNDTLSDPNDTRSLYMPQFAISVDKASELGSPERKTLGKGSGLDSDRLAGRSFYWFSAHKDDPNLPVGQQANKYFDNLPLIRGTLDDLEIPFEDASDDLVVRLWREYETAGGTDWYLVDKLVVDLPPTASKISEWHISVQRDTQPDRYIGGVNGQSRWRMVTAFEPGDAIYEALREEGTGPPVGPAQGLGQLLPSISQEIGPSTPLHLMNAGTSLHEIHGVMRPASFPTVGFMLFIPRFSHTAGGSDGDKPMGYQMREQWFKRMGGPGSTALGATGGFPCDFGHMPIFDNAQTASGEFADNAAGKVPWGLLVFDYFTTLDPGDANGDGTRGDALDPYRVAGRVNINTAPWHVLAGLPLMGPTGQDPAISNLPVSPLGSPAFWSYQSGVLAGEGSDDQRYLRTYPAYANGAIDASSVGSGAEAGQWYRLGPYLAQAIAAYRDRMPYVENVPGSPYPAAHTRNVGAGNSDIYRPSSLYGAIRASAGSTPHRGFLTLGELVNVIGFDATEPQTISPWSGSTDTSTGRGDFFKAVSLMALLDTHFLTTRSNTYTIYVSLYDREKPESSVRSQMTIDIGPMLPRLSPDKTTTIPGATQPEIIAQRQVSYFNTRYER